MAQLAYTVSGLNKPLPNPFWLGSGPPTTNGNVVCSAFEKGWGGAVLKTISLDGTPIQNLPTRYADSGPKNGPRSWYENWELTSDRASFADWLADIRMIRDRFPERFLSVSVIEQFIQARWAEIIQRVIEAGAEAIELNMSCPHGFQDRCMGSAVGEDPELVRQVCEWAVAAAGETPVFAKLYPNDTPDGYRQKAVVALKAGCAGITATNTFHGLAPIDTATLKPRGAVEGKVMTGGISGLGILPLSLARVWGVASEIAKQGFEGRLISGAGGIYDAQGAVSHMCYGASTVQVCTAAMHVPYGPGMITKLGEDLLAVLEQHGLGSPADLIGMHTQSVVSHAELLALAPKVGGRTDADWKGATFEKQTATITAD